MDHSEKRIFIISIFCLLANLRGSCSQQEAVAVLQGQSGVQGVVLFTQITSNKRVMIEGNITGLEPGMHGFHVHSKGDLRNGCASTGGHFTPFSVRELIIFEYMVGRIKCLDYGYSYLQPHGGQADDIRHVGDLGNIFADLSGITSFQFSDGVLCLSGPNSIIGRAILVHQKEDDLGRGDNADSKKTGNAGARLACGLIGYA